LQQLGSRRWAAGRRHLWRGECRRPVDTGRLLSPHHDHVRGIIDVRPDSRDKALVPIMPPDGRRSLSPSPQKQPPGETQPDVGERRASDALGSRGRDQKRDGARRALTCARPRIFGQRCSGRLQSARAPAALDAMQLVAGAFGPGDVGRFVALRGAGHHPFCTDRASTVVRSARGPSLKAKRRHRAVRAGGGGVVTRPPGFGPVCVRASSTLLNGVRGARS
jgi:hypothetical protein